MQQIRHVSLAAALLMGTAMSAVAAPTFVNGITVDATTQDLSNDAIALNNRVGMFSDIYYDPNRKEWWGLSDRGPGGGLLSYDARVQQFSIDVNQTTGAISNFQVARTVKFTDPNGLLIQGANKNFNGLAPNPTNVLNRALDPEGFVVNPTTGKFLVSDEYGPSVYEFNRDGTLNRVFQTPANLVPRASADVNSAKNFASDAGNTAGKRTNRGFEGLAISPDGKYAYAMLQSAMLDEGAGNGEYSRIVKFDTATGTAVAQFAYHMETSGQGRGISALVALNDDEFLVLERNNRGIGVPDGNLSGPDKVVFRINLSGATDISNVAITNGVLPNGVTPVAKNTTPFIDLDANTLDQLGKRSPEKWEGLAIGPELLDGEYLILAGTDNDFSVTQNGTGTQFDVYFRPDDPNLGGDQTLRIQCDIGTFSNCITVNANGSLGGAFAFGGVGTDTETSDFSLIPGVLHAYKSQTGDLVSYEAPIPEPATVAMFGLGLAGLTTLRRRRS